MICSKCGKQIPDGQAICPYCQNNTVVNNVNMNANNIKPIKKKKPYKWIILIVAILLIIGVGVFAAIKIIPNIGLTTVTCTKTEPGDFDSDSYNFDKYQLVQTATYKDNEFLKASLSLDSIMQETSEDSAFEWYMDLTYYNHFNGMDGVTVNVTQKKNRVQMKWNIENNNPTILKEWPIYKTLDGFIKGLEDNGYVCKG